MAFNAYDLTLRQLQYAIAVADTLGFHKAALRCNVSQPTLSAQVKQLEDVLGVELFERDRRRVLVTAAGEVVVRHARAIVLATDDLLRATQTVANPESATLRIGVIPTLAPYLLPRVLPAVRRRFPKLGLLFREEKTDTVVSELGAGRLDAGLVAMEADIGRWASAPVMRDDFVVALPKGHPLAKRKRLRLEDLDSERVMLLEDGHCFRTQALEVCSLAAANEAEFRATSLATLAQMVSSGAAITLLPKLAVPVENRAGQLEIRPFASAVPHRTVGLIWRPQSPLSDTFAALAATLREASTK